MRKLRANLAYDGSDFHGWQSQPKLRTVQDVIQETIDRIINESPIITAASRTDAGVHAHYQVIHLTIENPISLTDLQRAMNALLPEDVAVLAVNEVDESFHARYSVKSKMYLYNIKNASIPDIFFRKYQWHIPYHLNLKDMQDGGNNLVGEHDFTSFRASSCEAKNPIREIFQLSISSHDTVIQIAVSAKSFLHHMVRNIVGTLVEIGRGKLESDDAGKILKAKDRNLAGPTAPPHGLHLLEISYDEDY